MFPSNFNIPIDQSNAYVPGGIPRMSEMSREDLERMKAKSDFRQGKFRQPRMQRPVGYPRPIQLRSPDNMIRGTTTYPMLDRSRFMQSSPQIADALALVNKRRVAKPGETGGSLSETMRNLPTPPRLDFDLSKIDPSKVMSPFDQSRLQDAIRNEQGGS